MVIEVRTDPDVVYKTPDEVVILTYEFKGNGLATGETLSTASSIALTPSGLTEDTKSVSGTQGQATWSGGTARTVYHTLFRATTSNSQTLETGGIVVVLPG